MEIWCVNAGCVEYQVPKTATPPPPGFEHMPIRCGTCRQPTKTVPA